MEASSLIIDIELISTNCDFKGWVRDVSGVLKYRYPKPESRDANEFLIKTFTDLLGISRSQITILKGSGSPFKRVKIGNKITLDELCEKLGAPTKQV